MDTEKFLDFLFWKESEIIIGKGIRGGIFSYTKEELLEYYENGLTFSELEVDKKYLANLQDEKRYLKIQLENTKKGYIYVIRSWEFYKIWKTINPNSRIKKYITENPNEIEVICFFETENYNEHERLLHTIFAEKRHKGEWFKLTEEDVLKIKNHQ